MSPSSSGARWGGRRASARSAARPAAAITGRKSGFAFLAGGGLKTGQVIGATDPRGENPRGIVYTPQNVLATLYGTLGIDPASTLPDHQGRPVYLLDDRRPVAELV